MINLLMFDLDGTLFDTARGISNAFNCVLNERGEAPLPHELITTHIGTGLRDLLSQLDAKLQHRLGDINKLENDFYRFYDSNFLEESIVYPHIAGFLKEWPYEIAVVSNKKEFYVRELIVKKELQNFPWRRLIGGNTFAYKKPHPLPLQEAMKEAGVTARETLMIGDGEPDILAAGRASVKSVAVSFGYTPISELIQLGADAAISTYEELPKVIRSFS